MLSPPRSRFSSFLACTMGLLLAFVLVCSASPVAAAYLDYPEAHPAFLLVSHEGHDHATHGHNHGTAGAVFQQDGLLYGNDRFAGTPGLYGHPLKNATVATGRVLVGTTRVVLRAATLPVRLAARGLFWRRSARSCSRGSCAFTTSPPLLKYEQDYLQFLLDYQDVLQDSQLDGKLTGQFLRPIA